MGQTDSKVNSKLTSLFSEYHTIQTFNEKDKFGEGSLLQSKRCESVRVLLKEINLTDDFQFNKSNRKFEARLKLNHPNIINLKNQFHIFDQQLCGQFYKIYLVFEYVETTLSDIMSHGMKEDEIWQVLNGAICGLSFMQSNQLSHGSVNANTIYIQIEDLSTKVADPNYFSQVNMYTQVLQNPNYCEDYYLSPTLTKSIVSRQLQPKHNVFKSDVFSLGMTMLQVALNQSCDDCYKYEEGAFLENVLQDRLDTLRSYYSEPFCRAISLMVQIQEEHRPDFIQLSSSLKTIKMNNNVQSTISTNPSQTNQVQSNPSNMHSQNQSIFEHNISSQSSEYTNSIQQNVPITQPQLQQQQYQPQYNFQPHVQKVVIQQLEVQQAKVQPAKQNQAQQYSIQNQPQNQTVRIQKQSEVKTNNSFHLKPPNDLLQPTSVQFTNPTTFALNSTKNSRQPMSLSPFSQTAVQTTSVPPFQQQQSQLHSQTMNGGQTNQNQKQIILQRDIPDVINSVSQQLDRPCRISVPDENIDPQSNNDDDMNQLRVTKRNDECRLSQAAFQPLQDYTNVFQQLDQQAQKEQAKQQSGFQYETGSKLHLNHTLKVQAQEKITTIPTNQMTCYAENQAYNSKAKETFSLPYDLPTNMLSYNFNFTQQQEQGVQNEEDRNFSNHQIPERNDWKITNQVQDLRYNLNQGMIQQPTQQLYQLGQNDFQQPYQGGTLRNQEKSIQKNSQQQLVEYVLEQYSNGSKYEGDKADGMRHGQGKFYYQDGGLYDGGWFENRMHGRGILYYATGKPAYDGEWVEDKFEGFGTLYNEQPMQLQYEYDFTDFDNVEDYWVKYQGEFSDDNKDGKGTLFLSNGEKFVGAFSKDFINGPGMFYCLNGRVIDGRWSNNKLI